MSKLNYLNIGCGNKFHKDWTNIDIESNSPFVISYNLLNGLPFADEKFEVIYHSQLLEHFPREKALDFIKECYRVLKPDGIIRIVVPDLEYIVNEYKNQLNENVSNPSEVSLANYDWSMLELYDQTVRNYSGGQMAEYLKQAEIINEKEILDRIGIGGRKLREQYVSQNNTSINKPKDSGVLGLVKKIKRFMVKINFRPKSFRPRLLKFILTNTEFKCLKLGKFRLSGEIHFWMYDRFSLKMILERGGFKQISFKSPLESEIPDWASYELDVKNGSIYDPNSLFIEGIKI
jgi:predicted SAM-dependent methyltransferase